MAEQRLALTQEFDEAFRELSSARRAYEDEPRDPARIAALGAARIRLDDARRSISEERRRLGLDTPWRLNPAPVDRTAAPPLWSADHGPDR